MALAMTTVIASFSLFNEQHLRLAGGEEDFHPQPCLPQHSRQRPLPCPRTLVSVGVSGRLPTRLVVAGGKHAGCGNGRWANQRRTYDPDSRQACSRDGDLSSRTCLVRPNGQRNDEGVMPDIIVPTDAEYPRPYRNLAFQRD